MRSYGTYMFHPDEAPGGRLFSLGPDGLADLEKEGWVDSPAKFQEARKAPKKARAQKAEDVAPEGPKDDDAPQSDDEMSGDGEELPEGEGFDPAEVPDDISGMTDDDLREALKAAGVDVHPRTGRAKLEAAFRALNEEE